MSDCFQTAFLRRACRAVGVLALAVCLGASTPAAQARGIETSRCLLADGFDYPVGKPEAVGYFKARGFWPNGHLGEDWNGVGGGDTDLGDPIYAIGRGIVVLSEDVKVGWGNCIIIRHIYREPNGKIEMVDSLYGHLLERKMKVGDKVERGQLIGKMGNNNGMYPAHLHLEVRKNLSIGMNRTKFARDYSNYYSPTAFIKDHRQLAGDFKKYEVPVNTFAPHGQDLNADQIAFAANRVTPSGSGTPPKVTTVPKADGKTGVPKVDEKKKPSTLSIPMTTPGTDSKGDFWSRLKSKLNNGEVTDPSGRGPK